ncbi:formate dehydrogenase accessory sulfurtransferase FdhD [Luteibacter aegosomatis]|uniref:formate dehydrogenase accessory sulfurtransferase FdhD n=1 Tax=Luteibacter aegosomatis TaxID=2911537 RepID=UPI001FF825E8|nr:formate dehydrogenase accessory sulfurtransferase FdhD [Luteibacter aegosomatis]UPG85177.1 formate dehydrogenase accessory sulfurtransferase FdhD [Luteibacter aegosomatis]
MRDEGVPPAGCATRPVWRVEGGRIAEDVDRLAEEVPVAMHVDGEPFAVMMASPVDIEDFARGFALTEGRVASIGDIASIDVREVLEGVLVDVRRASPAKPPATKSAERLMPGRSGCGMCGSRELEDVVRHPAPVAEGPVLDAAAVERALQGLRERQPINAFTGSVHAAAWARANGDIVLVREDVGRHNALDKLIGAMSVEGIGTRDGFVVITSRASYEMVTKAAVAGMAVVVAISAPTALAVHLARECRVTLIGFARTGRFNVYSHPERLLDPESRTGSAPTLR